MTKESLAWLIIRAAGLFFLVYAFLMLPAYPVMLALQSASPGLAILSVKAICALALAYYLLRHGKAVHRLLTYEASAP